MKEYKVKTYEEAVSVIQELGFLPLAPLVKGFPALNTITIPESWHSDAEFDPWSWRTKFSVDGRACYGKFLKKKSILVSPELLPYFKAVLGHHEPVEERYQHGNVSREALSLYDFVKQDEGIDTRELRTRAGSRDKEKKKAFENALLELQGSMDIVISGIKEKVNSEGESNGWSSTSFETYESWAGRNKINPVDIDKDRAREYLVSHFNKVTGSEQIRKLEKMFL